MADIRPPEPAKPFCALLAGKRRWLENAVRTLEGHFGEVDLKTEVWPFHYTDYYKSSMGAKLLRQIISFKEIIDPADIVEWKLATNALERQLAQQLPDGPERPLNIDPGYLVASKMVLATAKNYAHRIYLDRGIYAEITLKWSDGEFVPHPWTYPDYRSTEYRNFFRRIRERYMEQKTDITNS
ncbi:MAG: DUF4416 family protein [Planctomycetota bacterium]